MKIRFSRHTQLYIIIVLCFILLSFVSVVNCEANETEPEPAPVEYATKEEFNQLVTDSNHAWLIFGSALVFIMQAGFAFLEAGGVRKKSLVCRRQLTFFSTCIELTLRHTDEYSIEESGRFLCWFPRLLRSWFRDSLW